MVARAQRKNRIVYRGNGKLICRLPYFAMENEEGKLNAGVVRGLWVKEWFSRLEKKNLRPAILNLAAHVHGGNRLYRYLSGELPDEGVT